MATSKRIEKQGLKRDYGTKNIERARKVESLEQGREARERAEHAARAADPRVAARRAKRLARQEHRQAKQVNIVGRPGQDPAAMQAAAREAAAVGQQPGTGSMAKAVALANQAATSRAEADKQALGALAGAADPWGADVGKAAVSQGVTGLLGGTMTGGTAAGTRALAEGTGAEKDEAVELAKAATAAQSGMPVAALAAGS